MFVLFPAFIRRSILALPVAVLTLFPSAPSFAQPLPTWVTIKQFPANNGYISSIYATTSQIVLIGWHWNVPNGGTGMVMRTTDGGVSWTNCTTPALSANSTPQVTDIWFMTPDTGWLTVAGGLNLGDTRLWRTIDSGKTWTAIWNKLTSPFLFAGGTAGLAAVWQTDSTLVVTQNLGVGVWFSKDTGATWTSHASLHQNGLAFDHLLGVSTEFKTPTSTTTFLTTTDGGQNWVNSIAGFPHEGWNLRCIPNTGTFVAAPEDIPVGGVSQPSHVYRSTTYGLYWSDVIPNGLPINTTGDVEGIEGLLFVQNSGGIVPSTQGLMESTDAGSTWTSIGGPNQGGNGPLRQFDTRFAVSGCGNIIYASDFYAGLHKTVDASGLKITDKDTMRPISAIICDTTKQLYFLHDSNTGPIIIHDIRILDSTRRPAKTGAVWIDSLPDPNMSIQVGDSIAFKLAWHPGAMMDTAGTDSATIRVILYATYLVPCVSAPQYAYDTVLLHVKLHSISVPADYALSALAIKTDMLPSCTNADTSLTIINNGCDSLALTKALLVKGTWTLTDSLGNALKLPLHIGSRDTLRLLLHATPTSKTILFDSLHVQMHYQGHDTAFGVTLRTNARLDTAHPALTTLAALPFDSLATCDSTEKSLTLANTGCDTLSLSKFDLANGHFELLDTNGKPLALPLPIVAGSSREVKVRFIPGTLGGQSATLRLHYHRAVYGAFDSSNVVALSGTGSSSGTLAYAKTLDFGNVSICQDSTAVFTFVNTSCDSARINSLSLSSPFVLLDSTEIPIGISSGKTLKLRIRYRPGSKQAETGTAVLGAWTNNGQTGIADTLHFTGTGIPGTSTFETNPPLSATTFAFGTLSECDKADSITFAVYNTGCDTLHVTSLTLDPGLTGTFKGITDKSLPAMLATGDSLHVTLAITALVTNTYAGNFHIHYALADGSVHDLILPVSLTVTAATGSSALNMSSPTSFDFKTVRACSTPDTQIVISNTGCGTDTVFLSLTGTGFTLGAGSDTVLITPFGTARVPVYYDGTSQGNFSATLGLRTNVTQNNLSNVLLSGNAAPSDSVHFLISFSQMPIRAGETFNVLLKPDLVFSGAGLDSIHGVFEYRSDDFDVVGGLTSVPGVQLQQDGPNVFGKTAHYTFDIKNTNGIALDPATPIVTLPLQAMVSDSVAGMIWVDSLLLDGGDTTFNHCVLATSTLGLNSSLAISCGDSTLMRTLSKRPIIAGERLHPNPVTQEHGYQTTLDLLAAEDGVAEITLFNALGQTVSRDRVSLTHDEALPYNFDLQTFPAGSYYYSVRFTGSTATGGVTGTLLLLK